MNKLWSDPQLAFEMSRRAEERYWKLFTSEKMVKSHLDLYLKVQKENVEQDEFKVN
jgi:hypothetical protein